MPSSSIAPRFAEMNANPVTHAGNERPDKKKSRLLETERRAANPMPSTTRKYAPSAMKSAVFMANRAPPVASTVIPWSSRSRDPADERVARRPGDTKRSDYRGGRGRSDGEQIVMRL